ncbi:hypothetical protein GCM10022221_03790 [Actinocorallia aurea]
MTAFGALQGHDAYAVLGLSPDATDKEVQAAHRSLVFAHHPDRNGDDPAARERTVLINAARDVLLTDRASYDRWRTAEDDDGTRDPWEPPDSDPWAGAAYGAPAEAPDDPWADASPTGSTPEQDLSDDPYDDPYEDPWDDLDDPWDDAVPSAWSQEQPPPHYPPPPYPPPPYAQPAYPPPAYPRPPYPPPAYPPPPHHGAPYRVKHRLSTPRKIVLGVLALFFFCPCFLSPLVDLVSRAEPVPEVPAALRGTWTGTIKPADKGEDPWKVRLVLTAEGGTTSYPGHKCKGTLTVGDNGELAASLWEDSTGGDCGDSRIRVLLDDSRRLGIKYCPDAACDRPTWTGVLKRGS